MHLLVPYCLTLQQIGVTDPKRSAGVALESPNCEAIQNIGCSRLKSAKNSIASSLKSSLEIVNGIGPSRMVKSCFVCVEKYGQWINESVELLVHLDEPLGLRSLMKLMK